MKNKKFERILSAFSVILFFILAVLALGSFGLIKTGWVTFTPGFSSIATIIAGIMLIVHTFLIGKKVNLSKEAMPKANLVMGIVSIIIGMIIFLSQPVIIGVWVGVLAMSYLIIAILLGRELIEDLINA